MKKVWSLPLLSLSALLFTQQALAVQTCAQKEAVLKEQISTAERHNNSHQAAGLKTALTEVQTHCTPESVRQDAEQDVKKLQRKLADKKEDVQEAQQDLQKATAKSDQDKIAKYQRKIAEKQADVEQITTQLQQAQKGLESLK